MQTLPPKMREIELIEVGGHELAILTLPARPEALVASALSNAEQQVFHAIREGRSNEEVAAQRGTSPRTIANQPAPIYTKLAVSSPHELCALTDDDEASSPGGQAARAVGMRTRGAVVYVLCLLCVLCLATSCTSKTSHPRATNHAGAVPFSTAPPEAPPRPPILGDQEICVNLPSAPGPTEQAPATVRSIALFCREAFMANWVALDHDHLLLSMYSNNGGSWLVELDDQVRNRRIAESAQRSWNTVDRGGHRHTLVDQGSSQRKTLRYEVDGQEQSGPPGNHEGVMALAAGDRGAFATVLYQDGGGVALLVRTAGKWKTTHDTAVRQVAFSSDDTPWLVEDGRVRHGQESFPLPVGANVTGNVAGAPPGAWLLVGANPVVLVSMRDGTYRLRWLLSGVETSLPMFATPALVAVVGKTPVRVQGSEERVVWLGAVSGEVMIAALRRNFTGERAMRQNCRVSDGVARIPGVPDSHSGTVCEDSVNYTAITDETELVLYRARGAVVEMAGRMALVPPAAKFRQSSIYGYAALAAGEEHLALVQATGDGAWALEVDLRKLVASLPEGSGR